MQHEYMSTGIRHVFRNAHAKTSVNCELHWTPADQDVACQIFQLHPCDVTFDDLPQAWTVRNQPCNTITLPCKHVFHVSALALHFVLSDMRCPVCRAGHECMADISSIPKKYQKAFQTRKRAIQDASDRGQWLENVLQHVEINVTHIEHELSLVVDISQANLSRWIVQSPIRVANPDSEQSFQAYRTQQSFVRNFNLALRGFNQDPHVRNAGACHISFALFHPVFARMHTVSSMSILLSDFLQDTPSNRAWPILFTDDGETRTAGAVVVSQDREERQLGIFVDRQIIIGLCIASIHAQLAHMMQ